MGEFSKLRRLGGRAVADGRHLGRVEGRREPTCTRVLWVQLDGTSFRSVWVQWITTSLCGNLSIVCVYSGTAFASFSAFTTCDVCLDLVWCSLVNMPGIESRLRRAPHITQRGIRKRFAARTRHAGARRAAHALPVPLTWPRIIAICVCC